MRIRLGLKTHKGTLGAENEDRFLIGMDPASNDWLYSPEEISVGEFGTLILLADGLRENGHGSKAANLVCQTIKKLFDEMLEIPPDQEGLISLLRKFFIIANQQLILKTQENQDIRGFGCSASMVLIKDDIAYVVWVGNCRVYRYSKKGVAGSYFCNADRLEQLNVDHQVGVEKKLLPKKTWSDDISDEELTIHFGMAHQQFLPGVAVVQLHADEKIMICTEGLFGSLDDQELEDALSQSATPDVHSEDLITKAFNANATESISVIIAEMLNGPTSSPNKRKDQSTLKIEAIGLLGHTVADEVPSTEKNQDHSSGIEPGTKDFQSDITPMKVRTVLPDDRDQDDQEQFFAPTPKKEQKPEEILPPKEKSSKISAIENALKKEQLLRKLTPGSKKEGAKNERQPERDDLPVSKSKPRIMATAYPDPDDHSDTPRRDTKEPSDDVEEKTEPKIVEESETPEVTSDDPGTLQPDIYEEDPDLESMEDEEVEEEFDGEEEPGDPFIADDPGEDEVDKFAGDEEELEEEAIDDEEVAEFLPDPIAREFSTTEEVDQEMGSPVEELESDEDTAIEEIEDDKEDAHDEDNDYEDDEEYEEEVDDEEVEEEVEPTGSDDPAEDLVIPSIYADEMVAPLDSFQSDEDKEAQEELEKPEPEEPISPQSDRSSKEPTSTQKSISSQSATIGHASEPSEGESDTPHGRESKPSKGGLGIRIGVILVAILLLGMFICNQMGSENMEDLGLDRVNDRASNEVSNNQDNSDAKSDEDTPDEESTADIAQEAIVEKPEEKPEEEKKEEKPKEVVKEKEPERLIKEPDYDDRIKENKQQLTGEVEALLKQKNALCRQINTYQKNAPSKKQDKIKELVYDCDQLDKKFVSIYDSRSGFFKTVRYDLLSSTINNIKFSIEQAEKKFEGVRSEQ